MTEHGLDSCIGHELEWSKRTAFVKWIENHGGNKYFLICSCPASLNTLYNCSATHNIFWISHRLVLHDEVTKGQ